MRGFFTLILICMFLIHLPADAENCLNPHQLLQNENCETAIKTPLTIEDGLALANSYMTNKDFVNAEIALKPIYEENFDNQIVINAYLNCLLAQRKTTQAYQVIKCHHLETTKEGYMVRGDMAVKDRNFAAAENNYCKALQFDPENIVLKNKLAQSYRGSKCINKATQLYQQVLGKDPNNLQAKLGLGYLELDKKNFEKSRSIFRQILVEKPCYKHARKGIIYTYLAQGDNIKALELLRQMPDDADIKLMRAETYYDMGMYSDARKNIPTKEECEECERAISANITKNKSSVEILVSNNDKNLEKLETVPDKPELNEAQEPDTRSESSERSPVRHELMQPYIPDIPGHETIVWPEAGRALHATIYGNAEDLKYKIRRNQAITLTPSYTFLFQQLADEFKLDYHKFGIDVSKNTEGNKNVFMEYNVIIYTSGTTSTITRQNNVTNEFKGGVQARPNEKWEYRADLGVKAFEFGNGAMLTTDSWIKHYFNDGFNMRLGYKRNNIEQSYLAAVGEPMDGVFTGRAADNKVYTEFEKELPYEFYIFGRGAYGAIYAQNLVTNQYTEGMIGIGRLFYNNPNNKWINTLGVDIISYNSAYQYNLLNLFNSAGKLFGGYFSPSYYNATTANLKLEGNIKKWHLSYGLKFFSGIQTAMSQDFTQQAWGLSPYVAYDLNDNICLNLAYNYYNYASVQREQFIINLVIRGFKKHAKN